MPSSPVLAVVIPVYNEERQIRPLLRDWLPLFRDTGVTFRVILIDDGSKDNSLQLLKDLQAGEPSLDIHTQPNAGHGPAILKGYQLALDAEWVFQIDSDHQLSPATFRQLWNNRDQYDFLLAERKEKNATTGRQCISAISSVMVRLFYGGGSQKDSSGNSSNGKSNSVKDVNSPYRLMRSFHLRQALERVPHNSFAPNVLLTSWFILKKTRIFTTIAEEGKEERRQSKMNGYFLRGAFLSSLQTILFRIRL